MAVCDRMDLMCVMMSSEQHACVCVCVCAMLGVRELFRLGMNDQSQHRHSNEAIKLNPNVANVRCCCCIVVRPSLKPRVWALAAGANRIYAAAG